MANQDFQDRLSRIGATPPADAGPIQSTRRGAKPDFRIVGLGGAFIGGGSHVLRKLNEHYASLRDEFGLDGVVASGVFGVALLITGCVIIFRALKQAEQSRPNVEPAPNATTKQKPGGLWTLFGTIHGLLFGFLFILFVQASGYETYTGKALDPNLVVTFAGLAVFMGAASLLHPIFGLIFRKRGFHKAFGFFLVGTLLMGAMGKMHLIVPIRVIDVTPHIQVPALPDHATG